MHKNMKKKKFICQFCREKFNKCFQGKRVMKLYKNCKICKGKLKFQMIRRGTCAYCHGNHISKLCNEK